MKTILLVSFLLASSVSFAAEPTPQEVFGAILKDSGHSDATDITIQRYSTFGSAESEGTGNNLLFNKDGKRFVCSHAFVHSHSIAQGEYLVDASVANCHELNGIAVLRLNNDYTENGVTIFRRVFYDNNALFRQLTEGEERDYSAFLLRASYTHIRKAEDRVHRALDKLNRPH